MQDRVRISVSQTRLSVSAGASAPAIVTVQVANVSQLVDQFTLSIAGGRTDWYDIDPERLSLFPGESGKATLRLHPPRRQDVIAGSYPLTVTATSRDQPGVAASAALLLEINPSGSFEAELVKAVDSGASGSYVLRIANLSDGALGVNLSASDPQQALSVELPFVATTLQPYQDLDSVTFAVRARPATELQGGQALEFTIEVQPQYPDPALSASRRVRLRGQFTFTPPVKTEPESATGNLSWKVAAAVIPAGAVAHFGLDRAFDKINWWSWAGLLGFGLLYITTAIAVLAGRKNAGALPWLLLLGGLPVIVGAAIAAAAKDPFWLLPAGLLVAAIGRSLLESRSRRRAAAPGGAGRGR